MCYFCLLIDHASLLLRLAKPSEKRRTNLMELLGQYSRNLDDVRDILKVVDNKKQSILHKLAFHQDFQSHQTLLEILNEFFPEKNLRQKEEILLHRNGKGDTILNVLSKEAKKENSLKDLKKLILIYTEAGLKAKLEAQKNPLKEAITTGNTKAAKILIDSDYSLVFDEKVGLNALHSCIRYRNPKLITHILEKEGRKGLNYNLEPVPSERNRLDHKMNSLLHYASDLNWPGVSNQEIDQGPDNTISHEDARIEILETLLHNDWSDIDQKNQDGDNCLHLAISNEFPKGAKLIIDSIMNLGEEEKEGNKKKGKPKEKRTESRATELNQEDYKKIKEKEIAAKAEKARKLKAVEDSKQKLRSLLNEKNNKGLTPLFLAIKKGFAEVVEKMINCKELDKEITDDKNRTAFYFAIEVDEVDCFNKIWPKVPGKLGNTRKKRRLLCYSAEKSIGLKVFNMLLKQVTETSDSKEVLTFEKLLESDGQIESPMHSLAKSQKFTSEKYKSLIQCLEKENPSQINQQNEKDTLAKKYLCHQDQKKNTPLHIAILDDQNIRENHLNLQVLTNIAAMLKTPPKVSTPDYNEEEKKELMQQNYLRMLMLFSNEWIQILVEDNVLKTKLKEAGVPTTLVEEQFLKILKDEGENGLKHLWFKTLVETNDETLSTLTEMLKEKLKKLSKETRDYFERIANGITPEMVECLKEEKKVSDMFIKSINGNLATKFDNFESKQEKLKLIADMIKVPGTNQALKMTNENGENFLSNLKKMPDEWFLMLSEDKKLRKIFMGLGDDDSLSVIIDKFQTLPSINQVTHPINLVKEIFEKKKKFPKSFTKLLDWEGEYHKNDSDHVRRCCYAEVDPKEAYTVNEGIQEIIVKTLTCGYFLKKALEGMFLVFLFNKMLDFGTDITLNVSFYKPKESNYSVFKDLPSIENCTAPNFEQLNITKPVGFNLECYFHEMNEYMLFAAALAIFAFNYMTDSFFVMTDKNTRQYKAIMIPGFCCWDSCVQVMSQSGIKKVLMNMYWYGILPLFNQVFIYIYGFWVRNFVRYWKKRHLLEKAIKKKSEDHVDHVEQNSDGICSYVWKLMKRCFKIDGSSCTNAKCYKSITQNDIKEDKNMKILNDMQDKCDKTVIIGKIVTASTENSYMPLLQLSILFPSFISLFPEAINNINVRKFILDTDNGSNWRYFILLTSVTTSLTSMGIALTETYFSKSGRRSYKTKPKPRWFLYFNSIIFQVVPKIFAYQVFAFGFVPHIGKLISEKYDISSDLGVNLIIPVLLTLPFLLSILRTIVFHLTVFKCQGFPRLIDSILFGLATMFVCSENDFHYRNDSKKSPGDETTQIEVQFNEEKIFIFMPNILKSKQFIMFLVHLSACFILILIYQTT